jgi:hypothetical protein
MECVDRAHGQIRHVEDVRATRRSARKDMQLRFDRANRRLLYHALLRDARMPKLELCWNDSRHHRLHVAGTSRRQAADARSDIFSLAAVLYEMDRLI